jgi:hypothetical protein
MAFKRAFNRGAMPVRCEQGVQPLGALAEADAAV